MEIYFSGTDPANNRLGGRIELIAKPGCRHHPHGLDDPSPVVDFIWRNTVPA
jgi:hypothetical protein